MNVKKPFGLDIGTNALKAVWLDRVAGSGFEFNACSVLPTPAKGMYSESPVDQEEMTQAIKKVVSDAKITTPYVNIALPEGQVYTRVIEMPVLSDKELASAMYWEAEQYIPVPLENITFDYKVLNRPEQITEGAKMDILLVGAPNTVITRYQKILYAAGLVISSLETEILAASRALITDNFPTSIIMNIGALNTSFAIIRKGIIAFTYSIPLGGISITRAIAADFGFTLAQAEEYKKVYGISGKDLEGKIGKATEPILASILSEVKKTVVFYNEKYKNADPIQQMILAGGTAMLPGIDIYFAQNSGIETAIANPWKQVGVKELPKELVDNAPDYTIAVGLAMKDYE